MLKIFTDTQFLTEAHRKEVFPLLFDIHFLKSEALKNYYEITPTIEACNIVIFPINYVSYLKHKVAFTNLLKQAKTNNKPIWIYTSGDYGFTNYILNSYTFRLGGFNSKLNDNSFIIPSFINDPYKTLQKDFSVLKKEEKPSIGFVGHAQPGFIKYIKEVTNYYKGNIKRIINKTFVDKQSFYPSSIKRAYYLDVLQKNYNLNTNFVLRQHYRAGFNSEETKQHTTQEFYNNMYNNAYTFCSRGVGNFSVRFYETLAMGRIPVLLNTDCRLPLDNEINWKQHCVIIEENDAKKMPERILEFHNSKSESEFINLQNSNRKLWETKLKRDKYFIAIHNLFNSKKESNV